MFFRPGAGVARSWRECCPAPPSPAAGGRERSVRYRHTVRHHRAEAKPGPPHVVRIGTDIFLRRGKCPRRRVRCGVTGRSMWVRNTKEANGPGRGRGFRFGAGVARRCPPPHAVIRTLCPGGQSVRLRRTTRRQRRARHSRQGRAGRAKRAGRAPGGDAVLYRPARQPGGVTLRLPQNGHFPSSWKMSETLRARVGAPRRTRKERQIPAHCPRPRHAPPLAFFDEKCTIPYREIFFPRAGEMKDGRTSEKGRRAADGGGAAPNAAGPGQTGGLL